MGKQLHPVIDGRKKCKTCEVVKDVSEFSLNKVNKRLYILPNCKKCRSSGSTETHRYQLQEARRKWNYGLEIGEYERILNFQNGVCAICKESPSSDPLCVDHDHKTSLVRGLICSNCNKGLGHFRDNTDILRNAINYLNGW